MNKKLTFEDFKSIYNIEIDETEFHKNFKKYDYNLFLEWIEDEYIQIIEDFKNTNLKNMNIFIQKIYTE